MAYDAFMMRAVLQEICDRFPNAKIEKVLQPKNDEVDLVIHSGRAVSRLCFNVGADTQRIQLSDAQKENPLKAPMFCMFLRKHLLGGRITEIKQLGNDRIAVFTVSGYDEMGFASEKKLVCEIMGKYANLMLLDREDKILSALKLVDFSDSAVRQVLPGLRYRVPDAPDKLFAPDTGREVFLQKYAEFPPERPAEKFVTATFGGVSARVARELVFRAGGGADTPLSAIAPDRLWEVIADWQTLLREHRYLPTVAFDREGRPLDYSYMDITYLQGAAQVRHYGTLGEMFDDCFAERDRVEKIRQRAHDLLLLLNNAEARTARKLALQRESLRESEGGDRYRRWGDLITANIYRLRRGMDSFSAVDYSDPATPEVEVPLDPRLSPAANAQKMYKLYTKSKTAREVLTVQIAMWEQELEYLASVRQFLERAESEQDFTEIRDELFRSGYGARMKGYKPQKILKSRPIEERTGGGMRLLIGRNNVQNDHLTFRVADKDDIWFHVKGLPGSHVILQTEGREPTDADYTEAAIAAARHSKATGNAVAVDYTRVRNVKKPAGAKPGYVIYKTNYTAYVDPSSPTDGGQ